MSGEGVKRSGGGRGEARGSGREEASGGGSGWKAEWARVGRALRSARAGAAARASRARRRGPGLRDVRPDQERYAYHERDDGPDRVVAMVDGAGHEMQRVCGPGNVQNPRDDRQDSDNSQNDHQRTAVRGSTWRACRTHVLLLGMGRAHLTRLSLLKPQGATAGRIGPDLRPQDPGPGNSGTRSRADDGADPPEMTSWTSTSSRTRSRSGPRCRQRARHRRVPGGGRCP